MGYIAAAAGIGSILDISVGAAGKHDANKKTRTARRKGLAYALENKGLVKRYSAKEQGELQRGLQAALEGIDQGKVEAGRLGRGSKQRVADSEQRLEAQIAQALQNSGFGGNASLNANAQRGVRADTQRAFADIDEGLGRIFSDLQVQRGQTELLGRSQLASAFASEGQQLQQINRDISTAFGTGNTYTSAPTGGVDLGGLAALFGEMEDRKATAAAAKASKVNANAAASVGRSVSTNMNLSPFVH